MEEIILKAMERSENPNKVRKSGYIPGVLSGPGAASASVKFETVVLNKIISKHGANAKMWVELGDEKKFGFVKEIQRHPVEGKIIHVAIQLVSEDQEIKIQLPIIFQGQFELEHRLLQIQVYKSEIEVMGKTALMPDSVVVDASEKKAGEDITAADISLPPEIKILDAENEIYAVIKAVREANGEEEDVKSAE